MYLHLGADCVIQTKNIIGIFDLDTTTIEKSTRKFLTSAEKNGCVETVSFDLPKSFILCVDQNDKEDSKIYISQLNPRTLQKRKKRSLL
ncbi:MAG: DUF370 domain-containing protein [Bacillota bacterium]|nr:DUF370 domain-containing protein [Bacillota bacterium]